MPFVTAGTHPVLSREAGGADDEIIFVFPDAGPLVAKVVIHGVEAAILEHIRAWTKPQSSMLTPDSPLHHNFLVHDGFFLLKQRQLPVGDSCRRS